MRLSLRTVVTNEKTNASTATAIDTTTGMFLYQGELPFITSIWSASISCFMVSTRRSNEERSSGEGDVASILGGPPSIRPSSCGAVSMGPDHHPPQTPRGQGWDDRSRRGP